MSATFFGGEIKYTKRYRLGQLLSTLTRHFLLMTATPHNGKEEDFQLFMALLDGDRFEGRFRDGVHAADVSDLMRRMVKENLLKFDGTPLFPERIAYTVPYKLSMLRRSSTKRSPTTCARSSTAPKLCKTTSAPEPSALRSPSCSAGSRRLPRRSTSRFGVAVSASRSGCANWSCSSAALSRSGYRSLTVPVLDEEDVEDLEDAPDDEVEAAEEEILDQATAARTIAELKAEIETLERSKRLALACGAAVRTRNGASLRACSARSSRRASDWRPCVRRVSALWSGRCPRASAVAATEARHLHRAPGHAELSGATHHHSARSQRGRGHHPRRHGPRRAHEGPGSRSSTTPRCRSCWPPTPRAKASTFSAPT